MQLNLPEASAHVKNVFFSRSSHENSDMNRFCVRLEQVSLAGSQIYKYLLTISDRNFGLCCLWCQCAANNAGSPTLSRP